MFSYHGETVEPVILGTITVMLHHFCPYLGTNPTMYYVQTIIDDDIFNK